MSGDISKMNGANGGRRPQDRCRRGHDLTLEGARNKWVDCIECRRAPMTGRPLPPECPKCGADLTDPANVAVRHWLATGKSSRECRPCKVVAAKLGGQKRQALMAARRKALGPYVPKEASGEHLSGAEVEAILSRDERREFLPPWIRHPQPLTDVHYRIVSP